LRNYAFLTSVFCVLHKSLHGHLTAESITLHTAALTFEFRPEELIFEFIAGTADRGYNPFRQHLLYFSGEPYGED